jgi:hypothetical protein
VSVGLVDVLAAVEQQRVSGSSSATDAWRKTAIERASSGFEQPVHVADLDGDGALEIYVGAENRHELRPYRGRGGRFEKEIVTPIAKGHITWHITSGTL